MHVKDGGMKLIRILTPDFRWQSGNADVELKLHGQTGNLALNGGLHASKGTISSPFLKYPMTNAAASIHLTDNIVNVSASWKIKPWLTLLNLKISYRPSPHLRCLILDLQVSLSCDSNEQCLLSYDDLVRFHDALIGQSIRWQFDLALAWHVWMTLGTVVFAFTLRSYTTRRTVICDSLLLKT